MITEVILSLVLGSAIGVSLGALGGGGSILTVPALVYALGVSARQSTGASLLIVGLSALVGMLGHARGGRVRWVPGLTVGIISVIGSLAGTALNKRLDPNLLLLLFAALMFVVAAVMVRRDRQVAGADSASSVAAASSPSDRAETAASTPRQGATTVLDRGEDSPRTQQRRRIRPLTVLAVAVGVGFLTGLLGVGGGFIIVPALALALGFQLAEAVGTSLLIIAISSAIAIVERGGVHGVAPHILWPFAGAAMAASLLGNQIAGRIPQRRLNQAFIALVIAVGSYVAIRSGFALG